MIAVNPFFGYFTKLQEVIETHEEQENALARKMFPIMQATSDAYKYYNLGYMDKINGENNETFTISGSNHSYTYAEYWSEEATYLNREIYSGAAECPGSYQEAFYNGFINNLNCSGCSIIDFQIDHKYLGVGTWMSQTIDTFLSEDLLTLSNGSFSNSIYLEDVFNVLADNPPTPLVEKFVTCRNSRTAAAIQSVGVSFSNTQVLVGIVFGLFLMLLKRLFNWKKARELKEAKRDGKKRGGHLLAEGERKELHSKILVGLLEEVVQRLSDAEHPSPSDIRLMKMLSAFKRTEHVGDTSDLVDQIDGQFSYIDKSAFMRTI
jgi:hypothetical protein